MYTFPSTFYIFCTFLLKLSDMNFLPFNIAFVETLRIVGTYKIYD